MVISSDKTISLSEFFRFVVEALPAIALSVILTTHSTPAKAEFVFNQVVLTGDLAPGTGGTVIDSLVYTPSINDRGEVAFSARLRSGESGPPVDFANDEAIFGPASPGTTGSPFGLVAREGQVASGAGGPEYLFLFWSPPSIDADGGVAFLASLQTGTTGPVVDDQNREAIFGPATPGTPGSAIGVLVREGGVAHGANGVEFDFLGQPVLNAAGDLAFTTSLRTGSTGPTVDSDNDRAIFAISTAGNTPPQTSLLAREGDTAPGTGGAEYASLISTPVIDAAGGVTFFATLRSGASGTAVNTSNDTAIFGPKTSGGELGLLVREGDTAPGAGGAEFSSFSNPSLNSNNQIAFFARLRNGATGPEVDDSNDAAIFGPASLGGPLTMVAREGDIAPDTGGAEFEMFTFSPGLSDRGHMVFLADLRTGASGETVDRTNDQALYAMIDNELTLILRRGDLFPVDPADALAEARTVTNIRSFNADQSFSDSGRLALVLSFDDSSSGIFTVLIPEPGALGLYLSGLLLMLRRRRGKLCVLRTTAE